MAQGQVGGDLRGRRAGDTDGIPRAPGAGDGKCFVGAVLTVVEGEQVRQRRDGVQGREVGCGVGGDDRDRRVSEVDDAVRKVVGGVQAQVPVRGGAAGVGVLTLPALLVLRRADPERSGVRGERLKDVLGAAGAGAVGEERGDDVTSAYLVGRDDDEEGVVNALGQGPVAVGEGRGGAFGDQELVGAAWQGQGALIHGEASSGSCGQGRATRAHRRGVGHGSGGRRGAGSICSRSRAGCQETGPAFGGPVLDHARRRLGVGARSRCLHTGLGATKPGNP